MSKAPTASSTRVMTPAATLEALTASSTRVLTPAATLEAPTDSSTQVLTPTATLEMATQVFSETAPNEIEEESLKLCQKKKRGPDQWKQNFMKHLRELGQEYTMRNGKIYGRPLLL